MVHIKPWLKIVNHKIVITKSLNVLIIFAKFFFFFPIQERNFADSTKIIFFWNLRNCLPETIGCLFSIIRRRE